MRLLRCCLLVLFVLLALFVLSVHAQDDKKLTVGFVQIGSESAWRAAFSEDIKAEAERRGIELLFYECCCKQENCTQAIRWFIEQKVDAILFVPVVETGWDEALQEARAAGIPVVVMDRSVSADESLYLTRISLDFVNQGRLAGAWLAQATSGTCTIVEVGGTPGSQAAAERQAGFKDVIALFPRMNIIASEAGDFTRETGKEAMQTLLSTVDPAGICAVWAHNDDMALGAIEAIQEAGFDPGDELLIVSIDGTTDMLKAIAEGDANVTVELSAHLAGPAFDAIAAYRAGEAVPKEILIRGGIFSPDMAAGEYERRTNSN